MANSTRTNSFLFATYPNSVLWIDYDPVSLAATALTVLNDGPENVWGEVELLNGNTFSQTFGVGAGSVAIPKNAHVTVAFDSDGVPALAGIARLIFRDPA